MYRSTKSFLAENPLLILLAVAAFAALWNLLLQHQPVDGSARGVLVWWTALCVVAILNVCCWRLSAVAIARRRASAEPSEYSFQQWQLVLSAVYVVGCGFRSILPRADVQRIGLFDSWASSVMVGRSVATIAELCFVAQWALLVHHISKDAGSRLGVIVSWLLVPLIVIAECCSWHAVLTTSYLGNAFEESLWALSATLLVFACLSLWSRSGAPRRRVLAAAMVLGVAYVVFMCMVDVPMYVSRWQADEASGRQYLSLSEGLRDVWTRWKVTFDWEAWRTEMPWMSLYFSVCVWCSIALAHVPRIAPKPQVAAQ
jgi:hypothetical protein